MTTTYRPVKFTASRVADTDAVVYTVEKVGDITLSLSSPHFDETADGEKFDVWYGAPTDPLTVNRVLIAGGSVVYANRVLSALTAAREGRWFGSQIITVRRPEKRGARGEYMGGGGSVPEATRKAVLLIVAALIEDYMAREDYPQMVAWFTRSQAPNRLIHARIHAASLRQQVAELQDRLAAAEEAVHTQEALCLTPQRATP